MKLQLKIMKNTYCSTLYVDFLIQLMLYYSFDSLYSNANLELFLYMRIYYLKVSKSKRGTVLLVIYLDNNLNMICSTKLTSMLKKVVLSFVIYEFNYLGIE